MNNRLHNVTNPFQGVTKKVLCVCSAGLLRSPTAANVLHREFGYNTRSAGLEENFALIPVDDVLLTWADEIVCMNSSQAKSLSHSIVELGRGKEVIVTSLGISDSFSYMDEELQQLIIKSYNDVQLFKGNK